MVLLILWFQQVPVDTSVHVSSEVLEDRSRLFLAVLGDRNRWFSTVLYLEMWAQLSMDSSTV
jgi:hypothetical protein